MDSYHMGEVNRHSLFSHDEFAQRKAAQFSSFLQALTEASEYSTDLTISPWQFSLNCDQAKNLGINLNDLRWMIGRNWIQCREEESESSGRGILPHEIRQDSMFIILDNGLTAFHSVQSAACGPATIRSVQVEKKDGQSVRSIFSTPQWNVERRELSVSGRVVKRFRWPAPNQETILSVFSEEGWPPRIEDPLPQGNGLDPKRRLGDTIKCLNRNQNANLIKFRGDGTGEGVFWDISVNQEP